MSFSSLYTMCFSCCSFSTYHLKLGIVTCVWSSLAVLDSEHLRMPSWRQVSSGMLQGPWPYLVQYFFWSLYWRLEGLLIKFLGDTELAVIANILKEKIKIQNETWMLERKPTWFNRTKTSMKALYWGWKYKSEEVPGLSQQCMCKNGGSSVL